MPPDGTPIDTILDAGLSGLKWFDAAIYRYNMAFKHDPTGIADRAGPIGSAQLAEAYDQQRGMNLQSLLDTASGLRDAAAALEDTVLAPQQAATHAVADASGDSAIGKAAQDQLHALVRAAAGDLESMSRTSKLIGDTVTHLQQCVQDKVEWFSRLMDVTDVAGVALDTENLEADDVSAVIRCAESMGLAADPIQLDRIARILYLDGDLTAVDVAQHSRDWVERVFRPWIEGYVAAYLSVCDDTDRAVRQLYAILSAALDDRDESPYPKLEVPSAAAPVAYGPNNGDQNNDDQTRPQPRPEEGYRRPPTGVTFQETDPM